MIRFITILILVPTIINGMSLRKSKSELEIHGAKPDELPGILFLAENEPNTKINMLDGSNYLVRHDTSENRLLLNKHKTDEDDGEWIIFDEGGNRIDESKLEPEDLGKVNHGPLNHVYDQYVHHVPVNHKKPDDFNEKTDENFLDKLFKVDEPSPVQHYKQKQHKVEHKQETFPDPFAHIFEDDFFNKILPNHQDHKELELTPENQEKLAKAIQELSGHANFFESQVNPHHENPQVGHLKHETVHHNSQVEKPEIVNHQAQNSEKANNLYIKPDEEFDSLFEVATAAPTTEVPPPAPEVTKEPEETTTTTPGQETTVNHATQQSNDSWWKPLSNLFEKFGKRDAQNKHKKLKAHKKAKKLTKD